MLRRSFFFCLVLLACFCFCLPASAGDVFVHDGITVERDVSPGAVLADGMTKFNSDYNRWRDASGAAIERAPTEYEGTVLYDLPTYLLEGDYAAVELSALRDCSNNGFLNLLFYAAETQGSTGLYSLSVQLYAGENSMVCEAAVPANRWCSVTLDIGSWVYRDAITRIELRLHREGGSGTVHMQFSDLRIDEPMDLELRERFLTDRFTARGGDIFLSQGASFAYLVATDNSPMLTANVLVPDNQTETNALRLVFDNETACKQITLQYAYRADGANARSLTLEVGNGRQTCLFEVPDAAAVRYIRLIFTGAKEGLITLRALNAVSVYESGIEPIGTIADCSLTEDGGQITVSGTVVHDVMIANRENCLALFRVDPWETPEQVLTDGREPDALADISIRFEFKLPLAKSDYASLGASYLVAIRVGETDFTYIPIADPRSLSVPAEETETAAGAIKGVQTDFVSLAGQAGVSIYLVDVYLDRLCDGSAAGYLYTGGGANCYFNRDELAELDREIMLRSAAGEDVYLRFLISDDGTAVDYAISPAENAVWSMRGILLGSDAARDTIAAITEFLTVRYAGGDNGSIVGIIVGQQVDNAADYNNIGRRSLSDYVDHYADLLTLIANCARMQNPAIRVVVPISDRRAAECITADLLENSYDSELFLRSLFMRIDDLGGPSVSLMLESEHNPFSLDATALETGDTGALAAEDAADSVLANEPDYYNADDLGDFSALLDSLSGIYTSMPSTFLYCWMPTADTGDALPAAYAYLYYRLRFSTHAEAFIVSFARAEAIGDNSGMAMIRRLMRYIDTDRSLEVSEPTLAVFGKTNWNELIENFDASSLARQSRLEGELSKPVDTTLGRYRYWDFSSAHSVRGWSAGSYVESMAVRGSGDARSLEAEFNCTSAATGEYAELIYRFASGEPFGVLDRLAFDFCIEGDGVWEINLVTGNSEVLLEQKQVVEGGQRVTLCMTTADLGDTTADYLRLCIKPVSSSGEGKLRLYRVIGESDTLGDEALDDRLRELRRIETASGGDETAALSLEWVFIVCAVLIFSITVAVILGRRQNEELAREEKKR